MWAAKDEPATPICSGPSSNRETKILAKQTRRQTEGEKMRDTNSKAFWKRANNGRQTTQNISEQLDKNFGMKKQNTVIVDRLIKRSPTNKVAK
jgi:hypothetical protein